MFLPVIVGARHCWLVCYAFSSDLVYFNNLHHNALRLHCLPLVLKAELGLHTSWKKGKKKVWNPWSPSNQWLGMLALWLSCNVGVCVSPEETVGVIRCQSSFVVNWNFAICIVFNASVCLEALFLFGWKTGNWIPSQHCSISYLFKSHTYDIYNIPHGCLKRSVCSSKIWSEEHWHS